MAAAQPGSAEITLRGLVTARWVLVALLGCAAALMALRPELVAPILGSVPTSKTITGYVVVLSLLAGLNLGTKHWVLRRRAVTTAMSGLHLLVDTAALTVLLGLTGGATNPFTTLYFVPITLATQVSPRWTWSIAVLSLAGFAGLYLLGDVPKGPPGHEHHFSGHLKGMWFSFGASGMLITYFVHRIAISLARQRVELTRLREQAFEDRHLASLGSLAAGAAHELGTPLGTIGVLAADLSLMDDEERADAMVSIRSEVKRCKEIVQRMATPDARVSMLAQAAGPWALADLASEADPIRGVDVQIDIAPEARDAQCDLPRESIGQIVRELLSNAAEACRRRPGSGGVELHVTVDGPAALIKVRDDGEGMDADTTTAAFDPFFSTKPEGEGMGLGLYLTRAQVRQLGGTIELSSRKDLGTEVALRLPLAAASNS